MIEQEIDNWFATQFGRYFSFATGDSILKEIVISGAIDGLKLRMKEFVESKKFLDGLPGRRAELESLLETAKELYSEGLTVGLKVGAEIRTAYDMKGVLGDDFGGHIIGRGTDKAGRLWDILEREDGSISVYYWSAGANIVVYDSLDNCTLKNTLPAEK